MFLASNASTNYSVPPPVTVTLCKYSGDKSIDQSSPGIPPLLLWNQKSHYNIYKSLQLAFIPVHLNPLQNSHPVSLRSILISSCHIRHSLPNSFFPTVLWIELLYSLIICYMSRPSNSPMSDCLTYYDCGVLSCDNT